MVNQHESFAPAEVGNSHASSDALRAEAFRPPSTGARIEAIASAPEQAVPTVSEMPAAVQNAIEQGKPIQFSSAGENHAANIVPDYYLTPEGKLVKNENAKPSADGSINIQIQSKKVEDNKSLKDAITHESEMQKQAAKEMIRLFQKSHPGQNVPGWMNDLANAKPNLPDFVPTQSANQPTTAPPENGFADRGVSGGNGGGFAGNGGFDSNGMFKGNGGSGDGTLPTGGTNSRGQPLGEGETVQAKQIYDYLTDKYHLSPVVASGILGNMQTESSFNTLAYNRGEGAIGLAQWEGGRRTNLEHFAASEGKPVTDWHVQIDFMMKELNGPESGAFARLQQAQTPQQAAAVFDQYYERSSGAARGQRMANADNIYNKVATA